jgi:hypothetical protein
VAAEIEAAASWWIGFRVDFPKVTNDVDSDSRPVEKFDKLAISTDEGFTVELLPVIGRSRAADG